MRPRNFVDPYRWYDEFASHARARGDEIGQRLGQIYWRTRRSDNSDVVKDPCEEGLKLAVTLDQPYWELYFRFRLYRISPQYGTITEDLIQMSVDINQPRFAECPLNTQIYQKLLNAYSLTDPLGHATDIIDGADYIEQNLSLDLYTYLYVCICRVRVYMAQRNWQKAYEECSEHLNRAMETADAYHTVYAITRMTEILYRMGCYQSALNMLSQAQPAMQRLRDPSWEKAVLMWYRALYKRLENTDDYAKVQEKLTAMKEVSHYNLANYAVLQEIYLHDQKSNLLMTLLNWARTDELITNRKNERLELYYDYLVLLNQNNAVVRIARYGAESRWAKPIEKPLKNLSEQFVLAALVLLPFYVILVMVMGLIIAIFDQTDHIVDQEMTDIMSDSVAKEIYEERRLRIKMGDYSNLS